MVTAATAVCARLVDGQPHRTCRLDEPEAPVAVDHGRGGSLLLHLERRRGNDVALLQPPDVVGGPDRAVGIVADEVGIDLMIGDGRRFVGRHTPALVDRNQNLAQLVCGNNRHVSSGGLRIMQHMTNVILDVMRAGKPALGLTVRLTRSGEIVRVARTSGHHFVRIDLQHALLDAETVGHIAQTAVGSGTSIVVRARGVDDPQVPALLDAGVEGICLLDVETAEEAERCVAATRFPPLGRRSYGGGYPRFDYRPVPAAEAMPALEPSVVCMVESPEALDEIDAIAAVPASTSSTSGSATCWRRWAGPARSTTPPQTRRSVASSTSQPLTDCSPAAAEPDDRPSAGRNRPRRTVFDHPQRHQLPGRRRHRLGAGGHGLI